MKDDIRAVVAVHRPANFNTAASLALLQEEVAITHKEVKKPEFSFHHRINVKMPLPLPAPPGVDKPSATIVLVDKKLTEGKTHDHKLDALRAFRRAKGLCVRCDEKGSKVHHCSTHVQLHVVQELPELFNLEDFDELQQGAPTAEQIFLAISQDAVTGHEGPRTMRLKGVFKTERY